MCIPRGFSHVDYRYTYVSVFRICMIFFMLINGVPVHVDILCEVCPLIFFSRVCHVYFPYGL